MFGILTIRAETPAFEFVVSEFNLINMQDVLVNVEIAFGRNFSEAA